MSRIMARALTLAIISAAAQQVLGRGNCFGDVQQLSGMSISVAQKFFHAFCKRFVVELYRSWIKLPTGEDLEKCMKHYDLLGFTGAMASADEKHVPWGRATASHTVLYTGKEGFPTLAYATLVDHSGRVLSVTKGYEDSQNDKTIVRLDSAIKHIRRSEPHVSTEYTLLRHDGPETTHQGPYIIVDGGYHKWRVLFCPMKSPLGDDVILWSKRLESVRKGVECFYGILKQRFRILKNAVPFYNTGEIDTVMWTCWILHNMLDKYDSMDELVANMEWAGADGSCGLADCAGLELVADPNAKATDVEREPGFQDFRKSLVEGFWVRGSRKDPAWLRS